MKKINLFIILLLMAWQTHAQLSLDVRKSDGSIGLSVDKSNGYTNVYGSISSYNTNDDGFYASSPGDDGLHVINAGNRGVYIENSVNDGIRIQNGTYGVSAWNSSQVGVQSRGSVLDGMWVGQAGRDGMWINGSARDGLRITTSVNDGINISGFGAHGVEISGGVTGLYTHGQANQGVFSDQAGREAGWFRNAASSTYPCLRVTAGDEDVSDIYLGGHGRLETQGSFTFKLDNNNNATESFDVIDSGGFRILKVSEDLNHYMLGSLALGYTTAHATGYRLSVAGKVMAEEVRVQLSQNWPDYVFKDDYELTPLKVLEKEIKTLGHLPGMPAAEKVEEEGFDLGEMNRLLVEKVEELTLHIIELNKEIEGIKSQLNK